MVSKTQKSFTYYSIMASPTQWTWVWVNSGSWWWTGRPGVLQFRGLQRVGHDWVTELTDWLMCLFFGSKITSDSDCSHAIKRHLLFRRKVMTNPYSVLKSNNGLYMQSYSFSHSHVQMWDLVHKEGWALKTWCFQIGVLKKTLESLLDCKEIKPVNSKGNQPWIFIGRTDAEAEASHFDHLMWRVNSLAKTLILGKIEGRRGRERWRMRWLDGITYSMDMSFSKFRDI